MPYQRRNSRGASHDTQNIESREEPNMAAAHHPLPNQSSNGAVSDAASSQRHDQPLSGRQEAVASPLNATSDRGSSSAKLPSIRSLLADTPATLPRDGFPLPHNPPPHSPLDPVTLPASNGFRPNPQASYGGPIPNILAPMEPSPRGATHFASQQSFAAYQTNPGPPPQSLPPGREYESPGPRHALPLYPMHQHAPDPVIDPALQQAQSNTLPPHPVVYGNPPIDPSLSARTQAPISVPRLPLQPVPPPSVTQYPLPPALPATSGGPPVLAPIPSVVPPVVPSPASPLNVSQFSAALEQTQRTAQGPSTPTYAGSQSDRYTCENCHKSFSRPSSLRIHMHSHTGEKPYICGKSGCGKAFSVRSNMKRHERGCHAGDLGHGNSQVNGDAGSGNRDEADSMDGIEEDEEDEEGTEATNSPSRSRRGRS